MLGGAMMLLAGCNKTEVQPPQPDSETEKQRRSLKDPSA